MITLITGLPGNGKTLFALWFVKQKAERENREVYYHNIKDLTLPWSPFDAEKWMHLPKGSIIVFDEAQFVFSKKPNGSKLPDFYEQLAVHRHSGFDLVIITQHPSLIDNFVRQLVGQHFHAVRKFGLQRATIYEWGSVNPGPQLASSQKSAIPLKWAYPKEVFGYYKSAEVHTVKRSIPGKLVLAVLFVAGVLAFGYFALTQFQGRGAKAEQAKTGSAAAISSDTSGSAGGSSGGSAKLGLDPVADAKQYVFKETPRVAGLPQTAPKYDKLTEPVRVPVPAACVQIGDITSKKAIRCKCYTQQGTPMDVEFNMCVQFAQHGFFEDFDADPRKAQERTSRGVEALASRPDQPIRTGEVAIPPPQPSRLQDGPVVLALANESTVSPQRSNKPDRPIDDGYPPSRAPSTRSVYPANSLPVR
jgi:zona occludens toxin